MSADLPGDLGPGEPGLDHLVRTLTSGHTQEELAGENAALAMFRANRRPVRHRRWRPARRAGLAAAAVTLALAGGLTAAYASALPAPVQHAAYHVLGIIGVPDRSVSAAGQHPGGAPSPLRAGSGSRPAVSQPPGRAHRGRSPASAAPVTGHLSLAATSSQIAAGQADAFSGLLISGTGTAIRGVTISLYERAAGQASWRLEAQAVTGPDGRVLLPVRQLTSDAWFRLAGPRGAPVSATVQVTVVPRVTARLAAGPEPGTDLLTFASRLANPGDAVVLEVRSAGAWRSVDAGRLGNDRKVDFTVRIPLIAELTYRAVLLATASHDRAVSRLVRIPPQHA
jgi:hypothetical protein